jgi:CheY-like chemotaxis protein
MPPADLALHILVVEDNPINRTIVTRVLEKRGHRVTNAANGVEALQALETASFDLILMDVQMPEMDGLNATAAIRKTEAGTGRHIPIVALTAHASAADRERCLAAGMDAFTTKPFQSYELLRLVAQFSTV